jgi:hypothetical protein
VVGIPQATIEEDEEAGEEVQKKTERKGKRTEEGGDETR